MDSSASTITEIKVQTNFIPNADDGSDVTQPHYTLATVLNIGCSAFILHLFSQIISDPQKTDYHVTNTILQLQLSGFE